MDKEEIREVLKKADNLESRRILIANSIRCLDCTGMNTGIEHVESPIARDQRQIVTTLIRKGYTDREIYEEVTGIFGKHSIIEVRYIDKFSKDYIQTRTMQSLFVCASTIALPILGYKLFRKFVMKK